MSPGKRASVRAWARERSPALKEVFLGGQSLSMSRTLGNCPGSIPDVAIATRCHLGDMRSYRVTSFSEAVVPPDTIGKKGAGLAAVRLIHFVVRTGSVRASNLSGQHS